jgi:FimV-like protein
LESATLSPHKPAAQPAIHVVSVAGPPPKAQPLTVKTGITLPSPQFSETLPAAIPPSQQQPAVENTPVSAAVVAPTPVPGIDVSAPTTNNQESASTEGQEESMPKSFLDSTMFLLVIGVVLMAAGLLLLIWLLWPRSRQQALPEAQTPPQSPELESEPEYLEQEQPEQPAMVEPHAEIHDYAPMKVSELENFEQLIEEEQEYLNPGQESENEDREYSFMDTKDAIPVKLDLARAYLEMGDYEAVNDTLKTVLAEGSKAQQREAELLLEQARLAQGD